MNNKLIMIGILFVLFLTSTCAMADDGVTKFSCGKTSITLYNGNTAESPFFVITVWNGKSKKYYPFPVTNEFLDVRCEKDKKGKDYLLVNHFCGGSGCAESNYALIDLATNKEVLKASEQYNRGNNKAASLLGKTVTPFSCEKRAKGSSTPNDNGEFCIVSPIGRLK